jgi:hypothetical protein
MRHRCLGPTKRNPTEGNARNGMGCLSVVDLKPCYGPVTSCRFCWPPLKKWWPTMLLIRRKAVTVKITMNRNLANPSHGGFCSSGSISFRFVAMCALPPRQASDIGLWFV